MSLFAAATSRRSLSDQVTLVVSSALGLGYLPKAPGTWGTLMGLPLWWAMRQVPWPSFLLIVVGITCVSIFVCHRAERIYGTHDVQHIVLDEVVGLLWSAVGVPFQTPWVVAAFVIFRIVDASKPGPIGVIDRKVSGGLGVVVDDVAAGLVTASVLHLTMWGLAHL